MTNLVCVTWEPIRNVVLGRLEEVRLAARALVQFVNVEEHIYEYGVTWALSAIASRDGDEAAVSIGIQSESGIAELAADVSQASTILLSLPTARFCADDGQAIVTIAKTVRSFLLEAEPFFILVCRRILAEDESRR